MVITLSQSVFRLLRINSLKDTYCLTHSMNKSMSRIKRPFSFLFLLLFIATPGWGVFTAGVDRTTIASHESFELTLRSDTDTDSAPDLAPLNEDFEILGTRQSRQVRIINGRSESWRDWIVTLIPKQTGNFIIPALTLDDSQSAPIRISIREARDDSGSNTSPVYIIAQVDNEEVYEQQEILLTLQILYKVPLYDESRLTPLNVDNALVQQLGETRKFETIQDGIRYGVFELKYSIHPQTPGSLEIPSLTFTGMVADRRDPFGSLFSNNNGRQIVARSSAITIDVKPRPDSFIQQYPTQPWLPARNLSIQETWSQSPENLQVGDAITRTITIEADGLSSSQLPPVNISQPAGVNGYPDRSNSEDKPTDYGLNGSRTDAIAMIPTKPGSIRLPAIKYTWFDTLEGIIKVAEIPEQHLTVKPADSSLQGLQSAPVQPVVESIQKETEQTAVEECPVDVVSDTTPEHSHLLWILAIAGVSLLWLLTAFLWFSATRKSKKARKTTPETQSSSLTGNSDRTIQENKAFKLLESSCQAGNAKSARQHLKQWCQCWLTDKSLDTLSACLDAIGSDELKQRASALEANLYSGNNARMELDSLLDICRKIRKQKKSGPDKHTLSDIYPE